MVNATKENDSFIYQKTFKTADKYGLDSLILNDMSMHLLGGFGEILFSVSPSTWFPLLAMQPRVSLVITIVELSL